MLVDSKPLWIRTEIELVASFGGVWTYEDGLALFGSDLPSLSRVLQRCRAAELQSQPRHGRD